MLSEVMLLKNMTGVEYAMYDKRHDRFISDTEEVFNDPTYIEKYCAIQSPEVFTNSRKGTCYETAWYFYDQLKKENYQGVTLCFLEFSDRSTHTLTIFKHKFSRLWHWIEYSWVPMRGIHGSYKNVEFLHDFIKRSCKKEGKKINLFNPSVDMSVFNKKRYVSISEWNKQMKA